MDWTTWRGATCLPQCWCEAARTGSWILEPVNTWTNLFFIIAGIIFITKAQSLTTHQNKINSHSIFPKIYGTALILVGCGSFFYHASQTFVGQWFDVIGMYFVSMFYISYNFYRIDLFDKTKFYLFYVSSCLILGIVIIFYPETRRWLFGVSILSTLIQSLWIQLKYKSLINKKYLYGAAIAYLVAQATWLLDKNLIWCDPVGWINGHGIWHILTGLAAVLTYFYFNSEKLNQKSETSSQ